MMHLRKAAPGDAHEWARLRNALWPGSLNDHLVEIGAYLVSKATDIVDAYVLDRGNGVLGGFIEINIRYRAENGQARAIAGIEGWHLDPDVMGAEAMETLICAAEQWALDHGFDRLASDVHIANASSIATHTALGFEEVDRMVHFMKKLA